MSKKKPRSESEKSCFLAKDRINCRSFWIWNWKANLYLLKEKHIIFNIENSVLFFSMIPVGIHQIIWEERNRWLKQNGISSPNEISIKFWPSDNGILWVSQLPNYVSSFFLLCNFLQMMSLISAKRKNCPISQFCRK